MNAAAVVSFLTLWEPSDLESAASGGFAADEEAIRVRPQAVATGNKRSLAKTAEHRSDIVALSLSSALNSPRSMR